MQLSSSVNCRERWRTTNNLLHAHERANTRTENANAKLCERFSRFFAAKIALLKRAVAANVGCLIGLPLADPVFTGQTFNSINPVTKDEVIKLIRTVQAKSSPLDFVPTSVIKSFEFLFAGIITVLANLSFEQGCFPTMYKSALVTPLLKKPGLDESNPANFRPISNLNNISKLKLLERLFFARFQPHVTGSANFSPLQSAYRPLHSTETAVLHTLNDIYVTADKGNATALVSLDLSAAFDMIEHSILLCRLQTMFGVTDTALSWLQSYLSGRQQSVRSGSATSVPT